MTAISPEFIPERLTREVGERLAGTTLRDWESGSFANAFEMQLDGDGGGRTAFGTQATQARRPAAAKQTHSGASADEAGEAHGAEAERAAFAPGDTPAAQPGGVDPASAECAAGTGPRDVAGAEGEADAARASASAVAAWLSAEGDAAAPPQAKLVLAMTEQTAELYVRDTSLDAASGIELVNTARQLLEEHQLSLGRARVNGRLVGAVEED